MKIAELKDFIELAKSSGVSELKYENGDEKYSVKIGGEAPVYSQSLMQSPMAGVSTAIGSSAKAAVSDGLLEITSPFVGTFYRSSSPDTGPYVKAGDKISKGQALCIVEAMKIMNEIESEISGEIAEVCVENETYVEFGQVLFKVKP